MISKKRRNQIFIEAGILTLFIYLFAIILNGYLDQQRINYLDERVLESELEKESLATSKFFYENFYDYSCELKRESIFLRQLKLKDIGDDLSNFGSLFLDYNKDISLGKQRSYYLEELDLYNDVVDYNKNCEDIIVPVFYFFDAQSTSLDKQALVLEQFSLNQENKTVVFSFDFYYDDEVLLELIKDKYDVTGVPFLIIGNKTSRNLERDDAGIVSLNAISVEFKRIRGEIND